MGDQPIVALWKENNGGVVLSTEEKPMLLYMHIGKNSVSDPQSINAAQGEGYKRRP